MATRRAIPIATRRKVLFEARHHCAVCCNPLPLEYAHIIPWSETQSHSIANLIALCANCHTRADKEKWGKTVLKEYKKNPCITAKQVPPSLPADKQAMVELLIRAEPESMTERERQRFVSMLAAYAGVRIHSIEIIEIIHANSSRIRIQLPLEAAEKLTKGFVDGDPMLQAFFKEFEVLNVEAISDMPHKQMDVGKQSQSASTSKENTPSSRMVDRPLTLNINVHGDNHGTINVAGHGIQSVWAAAKGRPFNLPIFVSYASDDREKYVQPLVARLEAAGYAVWYDIKSIPGGKDWLEAINQGLRKSAAVIVVLTPRSIDEVKHQWAVYEHREALRLFAPIISVIMEDCAYPQYFADERLQYIKAMPLNDESFGRIKAAIEEEILGRGDWLTDQTPSAPHTFIGREDELREVYHLMKQGHEGVAIAAVHGMGGIGKTMLAGELTRRLGPRFPGGVLYEMRGQENPRDIGTVFLNWLSLKGQRPDRDPSPDDMRGWLSQFGEMLVVIDDVWPQDAEHVKKLLAALPPDADRIITTRSEALAHSLAGQVYSLQRLSEKDGIDLLKNRFEGITPMPTDDLLRRLHNAVGGHALSLELAAGRYREMPNLATQIERLEQRIREGNLADLSLEASLPGLQVGRDTSLMVNLAETRRALETHAPQLLDRFMRLGVFAQDAPFTLEAASFVWGEDANPLEAEQAEITVRQLIGYGLLQTVKSLNSAAPLYVQHVILRAYALSLLNERSDVHQIAGRHFGHYYALHGDHNANNDSDRHPMIRRDFENLLHAADWGFAHVPKPACVLAVALEHYMALHLPLPLRKSIVEAASNAAKAAGFSLGQANILIVQGEIARMQNENAAAIHYYEQAILLFQQLGNRQGQADALAMLGGVALMQNNYTAALGYYQQAMPLFQQIGDRQGQAHTLWSWGEVARMQNENAAALRYYEQAMPLFQQLGNRLGQANTLRAQGDVARMQDDYAAALRYYEQAMLLFQQVGDRQGQAHTLNSQGEMALLQNDYPMALRYYEQAMLLFQQVGNRLGQANTLTAQGDMAGMQGDYSSAVHYFEQSLLLAVEIQDVYTQANIRVRRAFVLAGLGRIREAIEDGLSALSTFIELDLSRPAQETANTLFQIRQQITPEVFDPIWHELTNNDIPAWLRDEDNA